MCDKRKRSDDKLIFEAFEHLYEKINDLGDKIASFEAKLEKMESRVTASDESMHQVHWCVGSLEHENFKLGEKVSLFERKLLRLMKKNK